MSRTIFEALLDWAQANPDSDDLINRLLAASPQVQPYLGSRESSLRWLRTIELCLDHAERHGPSSNLDGVLDALICNLSHQFRTGIGAAWADDCIQRWLALPFSMAFSIFRNKNEIVHRCHAMVRGGRFDESEAATIAIRLRQWVSQCRRTERDDETLAFIRRAHAVRRQLRELRSRVRRVGPASARSAFARLYAWPSPALPKCLDIAAGPERGGYCRPGVQLPSESDTSLLANRPRR